MGKEGGGSGIAKRCRGITIVGPVDVSRLVDRDAVLDILGS
jgi:hypothetical protein